MNNVTSIFANSPIDQLYAVERHLQDAETALSQAIEHLLAAQSAHARAAELQAHKTAPALYARIKQRLTATLLLLGTDKSA